MIAVIRAWVDKYEIILMLIICGIMFWGGWWLHGVFNEASETVQAVSTLKIQQSADKTKFNNNVVQDEKTAAQKAKDEKALSDAGQLMVKSPVPKCNLTVDRIMLINNAANRK